jgi:hypothetical protein
MNTTLEILYNEIDDSSKPYAINIDELIVIIKNQSPSFPSSVDIAQKDINNVQKEVNEELTSFDPLYLIDWLRKKYDTDIKENNLFIDRFNNAKDDHSLGIQNFQSQNAILNCLLKALKTYRKILNTRKEFEAKEQEKIIRRIYRNRGSNINDSYFILDLQSEGFDSLDAVIKAHTLGITTKDIIDYINARQSIVHTFAMLHSVGFLEKYMKIHHLNRTDFINRTQSWFTRQYKIPTLRKPISYFLNGTGYNSEYETPLKQSKDFLQAK